MHDSTYCRCCVGDGVRYVDVKMFFTITKDEVYGRQNSRFVSQTIRTIDPENEWSSNDILIYSYAVNNNKLFYERSSNDFPRLIHPSA